MLRLDQSATASVETAVPPLHEGLQHAQELHEQGRLRDALAVLLRLWDAYPDSPHAPARASQLLLHFRELDAAEALIEQGQHAFPAVEAFFTAHARVAELRPAVGMATKRWKLVRTRFPEVAQGYSSGAAMLRAKGRPRKAEQLLRDGVAHLPQAFGLAVEYARAAAERRDWSAAAERWAAIRSGFPDAPIGHVGLCAVLREAGRLDEAGAVLEPAFDRWPAERDLLSEGARIASARGHWAEAAACWNKARSADPTFWMAWSEGALALHRLGQVDRAVPLLREAIERFAAEPAPVVYLGRILESTGEWASAAETCGLMRQRFPHLKEGHVGQATAFRMLGRLDEAGPALAEAAQRFPNDRDVMLEQVHHAYGREDWPEAAAFCAAGAQRFPQDNEFRRRGFEIHLRSVDAAAEVGSAPASPAIASLRPDARDLLMQFESLGGTGHGCEFGIYQRDRGAEPLGLLRWTDLGHEQLSDALETEFEGVGTPEQTLIFVPDTDMRKQYWTRDRRFYMVSGTSVFLDEVSEEKLFPQLCRRLQFLRRKMIDDLRAGKKIFVYKNMFRNLTDDELDRLYNAMRRYGDNTLFYLRYADATHPDGMVEWARPGLLVGYIEHFTSSPEDAFIGKPYDSFHRLTHAAHELWQADRH